MRTKKQTKPQGDGSLLTIYPAPMTATELNNKFVQALPKSKDGTNTYVEQFCRVMEQVLSQYPKSFSLNEASILNYQGIPNEELARLFSLYVKKLCELQVIDEIIAAYDHPIYARR
jgi:hypothetical protein